jgi:hypothetical protein
LSEAAVPDKPPLKGIRGWLLLLAIAVCLAPLRTLIDLGQSAADYSRVWNVANGKTIVLAELAINLLLLGVEIAAVAALLGKKKSFRMTFTWLWIAAVLLPVVDVVLAASLFPKLPGGTLAAGLGQAGVTFIVTGLWVWYVQTSRRVENTFTN